MPEMQVFSEILVAVVEWTPTVLLRESPVVVVDGKYLNRMGLSVVEDDRADVSLADRIAPDVFNVRLLPLCRVRAVFRRRIDARLRALPVGGVGGSLRRLETAAKEPAALEEDKRALWQFLAVEPRRRAKTFEVRAVPEERAEGLRPGMTVLVVK